jgi:hypothetical protein
MIDDLIRSDGNGESGFNNMKSEFNWSSRAQSHITKFFNIVYPNSKFNNDVEIEDVMNSDEFKSNTNIDTGVGEE